MLQKTGNKTENIHCTKLKLNAAKKQKIYSAQNGKYMLHKKENIRSTKQKKCSGEKGKYMLDKTEIKCCTKQKIYSAQN